MDPHQPPEYENEALTQRAATGENSLVIASALQPDPLTATIVGLTQGGNSSQKMMGAVYLRLDQDLRGYKAECENLRQELRDAEYRLGIALADNAVLGERAASANEIKSLRLLAVTVGGFLITTSIELFQRQLHEISGIVFFLGLLLILAGWCWNWIKPRTRK